jgi:hypothetical protein
MSILEGQKIKLKTKEIGRVIEVFKNGEAYMAEVFKSGGGISIETVRPHDIASVFVETEVPITEAMKIQRGGNRPSVFYTQGAAESFPSTAASPQRL